MSTYPDWTHAPEFPNGNAPADAYMDPPNDPYPWCALAGATKTQAWTRKATCYLAKPGTKPGTDKEWNPDNYFALKDADCQNYLDTKTHTLPAYQASDYTKTVTYKAVQDKSNNNYWGPQTSWNPPEVNQCVSVLSVDPWALQK